MNDRDRDPSAHVTRLYGAPGSGKTTTLLDFARDERDEHGTSHEQLLFLTFTKSARNEAHGRLCEVFPDVESDDLESRVKTLHGAALSACLADDVLELRKHSDLDAPGDLLIRRTYDRDAPYFQWFFRSRYPHIDYDTDAADPIEQLKGGDVAENATGNTLMALYDYVQSANWPLEHYHRAPFDVELPQPQVLDVLEGWEQFKDENDLIQDSDYLKAALEYGVEPLGTVLILDEFQDLSPLQYALYEQWRDAPCVDRVYIAGDVHQSIYDFRGADPMYFRETPTDKTIHSETSFRCRSAIVDAAVPIAEPVPEHDVSRVEADKTGGTFAHVDAPDADALGRLVTERFEQYGKVYLLARTNRQAGKLAWGLRNAGVPYLDLKPNGDLRRWKDPMPTLLAALRAIGDDDAETVPTIVAEKLLASSEPTRQRSKAVEYAQSGSLSAIQQATGSDDGYPVDQLRELFGGPDVTPLDVTRQLAIDDWQRGLLEGAIRSGAENDPADVRIGTIHAAKGSEAPSVLVFPAYSHRQLERFYGDDEPEERRLYYVAVTRAIRECLVVHDYFGGEEFPPLAK